MIKISNLLEEVEKIQQENPDVEYEDRFKSIFGKTPVGACKYVHANIPMCIMGVAMNNLGISTKTLEDFDQEHGKLVGLIIKNNPEIFEIDNESDLDRLQGIQMNQDQGLKWGQS